MITLKLNGEKRIIKAIDQLTVNEYIDFIKTDMNLINYLSVCLGIEYKEAFNIKLKNVSWLNARIGVLQDYTKLPVPKKLSINGKLYFIKNIEISTVGQRFMIEEHIKKLDNEEIFCFILAVGIVDDPMDIDLINKCKDKLMNEPYINILPLGFFLANRFSTGKNKGMNFLRILGLLINMKI